MLLVPGKGGSMCTPDDVRITAKWADTQVCPYRPVAFLAILKTTLKDALKMHLLTYIKVRLNYCGMV